MPGHAPRPTDESSPQTAASHPPPPVPPSHEFLRGLEETVNHHLRTALTPILGHTELLIEHQHGVSAEMHQSLLAVTRAGFRLRDVVVGICDLIGVACVDQTAAQTMDVSVLVADELERHRVRAAQRGVRFVVGGEPVTARRIDAARVRRALGELLDNALTYAPEESTVRVTTTAVASAMRITVSDDGDGIDPDDRERLVRPFERGRDPRRPAAGRRMGMGLALASAVAASHGGRLVLSESSSGGVEVSLELPAVAGSPVDAPGSPKA